MSKTNDIPSPDELDLAASNRPRRGLMSRRRFLQALGGAATAAAGLGLYTWRIEPHWISIVRRDLPIANLPDSLAGRTLALLADLHVGPIVDGDYIRGAMGRVNQLQPDMIAIVGDLMQSNGHERIDDAIDVVSRLRKPPMGVAVVLGNHDYGRSWSDPAIADALAGKLRAWGAHVLRNDLAVLDGLQVVGLDDIWANDPRSPGRGPGSFFDPERVLPAIDAGSAVIALVHNPDAADLEGWGNYRGWILCGHSHGGQVDFPLIGPPLLPIRNKKYAAGEVDLGDGRRLYVNRGVGYLRRVRFMCRPEITLFTLKAQP